MSHSKSNIAFLAPWKPHRARLRQKPYLEAIKHKGLINDAKRARAFAT